MTDQTDGLEELRSRIIEDPAAVLNDRDIVRALVSADDAAKGENVIDLKTVFINRMEAELGAFEDRERTLMSAAYSNVASTAHIHRAIIDLLEPLRFRDFLEYLDTGIANSLNVDVVKFCLEAPAVETTDLEALRKEFGDGVVFMPEGEITRYQTLGKPEDPRPITLRRVQKGLTFVHGKDADLIQSEALIRLNLGDRTRPGLLALGSFNAEQFDPRMGTDLILFYSGVFERVVRRWLADG